MMTPFIIECITLEAKNREAYNSEELSRLIAGAETSILDEATSENDITVYVNCAVRKAAIDRNKRCLLAYHMKRLDMIKKMRFELGPVIPAHIRNGKRYFLGVLNNTVRENFKISLRTLETVETLRIINARTKILQRIQ